MTVQQSHTPEEIRIEPRNREHDVAEYLSVDWFDNDPFKTAWFNSMSITFPVGEKFFIDSVRYFADQVEDLKLRTEIGSFCGQEGFHRREHQRYNESLCSRRGYDLAALESRLNRRLAQGREFMSELEQLAVTAALEHITAIMAESALNLDDPMMAGAEPAMRALWDWHAAEEMEHKSVAFDVYRAVGGGEKMRKSALRKATFFLSMDILYGLVHMLRRNGQLWNFGVWRRGVIFLIGRRGILRRILPAYKAYFRDNFHPWDLDTRELLMAWKT